MKLRKGSSLSAGMRVGIVAAKFNQSVTGKLLLSCLAGLATQGIKDDHIDVVRVPGAFEIPLVAKTLAENEQKIVAELLEVQGKPVDIGGYYRPDVRKASAAMRPSATLNAIIGQDVAATA